MFAARYRVEVRDKEGKLVTVLEDDSKSFTINFIRLLVASHYDQSDAPALAVYDVFGGLYYTGSTSSPALGGVFQLFNIDFNCWVIRTGPRYAVYLGTSPCPNPATANAPCGDLVALQPINLNSSSPCYGIGQCSPSLTESGWTFTITGQWLNQLSSPVTVGSMALVFGILTFSRIWTCYVTPWYAAIVDNLPSPITISPGWYITVSYTMYFPV